MHPTPSRHWPAHRTVAHMQGSLPRGGVVPMPPIHAVESAPAALRLQPNPAAQSQRHEHGAGPQSVVHKDCRVSGAVPKYLARINVMFGAETESAT